MIPSKPKNVLLYEQQITVSLIVPSGTVTETETDKVPSWNLWTVPGVWCPHNIRKWLLTDAYYKMFSIKKILNFKVPNVHNQAYRIIFRIKTITMTQFVFVNGCVIFNICARRYNNIVFLYGSLFYDSSRKCIHLKVYTENYALTL